MPTISSKIAYPIIIAGLFIIVVFIALNYQTLTMSFYFIFSLLIIYIFLFGFAIGQNFAKPVRKLLQKANELSKGDFTSRFYLENKDELGQLAATFNKIAEKLEKDKIENENMERSIDIKVRAKTEALEETINALEQKVRNRTLEFQKVSADLEKLQKHLQSEGSERKPKTKG